MTVRPWLPPLLWAGVIVFSTSMPTSVMPRQISPYDKALHFSMYAVLAALLTRYVMERGSWRLLVLAVVAVAAFGAVDEWHQRFIPGRSTELADWVADTLGGAVGTLAMALGLRRRRAAAVQ